MFIHTHARARARTYFKTSKPSFFNQKNQKNWWDPMKYQPQVCLTLKDVWTYCFNMYLTNFPKMELFVKLLSLNSLQLSYWLHFFYVQNRCWRIWDRRCGCCDCDSADHLHNYCGPGGIISEKSIWIKR